jgi:CDP-glucose 4,6-dehydratase
MLRLDSTKARQRLGWRPRWGLEEALARTIDWHRAWQGGADMAAVSLAQIEAFETAAAAARREAA